MSTATANGRPQRKQLSDQLDRLDAILDVLAEGLPGAVGEWRDRGDEAPAEPGNPAPQGRLAAGPEAGAAGDDRRRRRLGVRFGHADPLRQPRRPGLDRSDRPPQQGDDGGIAEGLGDHVLEDGAGAVADGVADRSG